MNIYETEGDSLSLLPQRRIPETSGELVGSVDMSMEVLSDGIISHICVFPSSGHMRKPQRRKEFG